ncbi:MAG: glutamate racemase [Firmicutes bacterium]|nr:glutamate racemase [Bacillota bacterium]
MDNRSIGIFDSGLGGLTVLKEIMEIMPGESIVYFGDSGRAPYGIKSKETVIKYTFQNIRFLLNQDIKMIVIACNTASAYSLETVKNSFDIPVIEVIQPGAVTGIKYTKNKKIGVIGTTATINSGAYERAINEIDNTIQVFSKACPLFVPLVEEGPEWWENDITYRIALEYLTPLKQAGIDTLVLGCTHYPLLQKTISKVMGSDVKLVSSALEVARVVKKVIEQNNIARDEKIKPVYRFYTSDSIEKFEPLCSAILNRKITSAERTDIEKY